MGDNVLVDQPAEGVARLTLQSFMVRRPVRWQNR